MRFVWGTVTGVSPLRVQIDGDDTAVGVTPDSLVGAPPVGARVRCELSGRRLIVHGAVDTGWVTSGIITPATNYTISAQAFRRVGMLVSCMFRFQYTGTAVTVPANGNITNQTIGTVATPWRPSDPASAFTGDTPAVLSPSSTGPVFAALITSAGNIRITAVGNSSIVFDNTVDWSCGGTYLV